MLRAARIVVADGSYLPGYLVLEPDVVLIAQGHEVSRGPHGGSLKVIVVAEVMLILIDVNKRVSVGIRLTDVHGVVGRAIVLDDKLVDGIGLGYDGVQLLPDVFFTIVGGHYHRNRFLRHIDVYFCSNKIGRASCRERV